MLAVAFRHRRYHLTCFTGAVGFALDGRRTNHGQFSCGLWCFTKHSPRRLRLRDSRERKDEFGLRSQKSGAFASGIGSS